MNHSQIFSHRNTFLEGLRYTYQTSVLYAINHSLKHGSMNLTSYAHALSAITTFGSSSIRDALQAFMHGDYIGGENSPPHFEVLTLINFLLGNILIKRLSIRDR